MQNKDNNGLILSEVKSESKTVNPAEIVDIKQEAAKWIKTTALVVAYLDHTVLIGRYDGKSFSFYDNTAYGDKYVQKIRIFNKNEELLIWRSNGRFKGRYRKDGEGSKMDVVDARQALFGTDKKDLENNFTRIFEKRGTEIILPFTSLDLKDKKKDKRVFIQTRSYIDYNEVGQATYEDCRFMGFYNNGKELI